MRHCNNACMHWYTSCRSRCCVACVVGKVAALLCFVASRCLCLVDMLTASGAIVCLHVQGLSSELGAFVAGVMLSSTDQQEHCLHQLTSIRHFFMSLFISTTGLVMSPRFLLQHLPVLAGGVLVCIICKTCLVGLRNTSQKWCAISRPPALYVAVMNCL